MGQIASPQTASILGRSFLRLGTPSAPRCPLFTPPLLRIRAGASPRSHAHLAPPDSSNVASPARPLDPSSLRGCSPRRSKSTRSDQGHVCHRGGIRVLPRLSRRILADVPRACAHVLVVVSRRRRFEKVLLGSRSDVRHAARHPERLRQGGVHAYVPWSCDTTRKPVWKQQRTVAAAATATAAAAGRFRFRIRHASVRKRW